MCTYLRAIAPLLVVFAVVNVCQAEPPAKNVRVIRSAKSGPWSAADTWEKAQLPVYGCVVQIRSGHTVVYDVPDQFQIIKEFRQDVCRAVHVAGTLRFAPDKDTHLIVGLLRIQSGESMDEEGFDCDAHPPYFGIGPRAALEVGTPEQPIKASNRAIIQLKYFEGMDKESLPAIVCCAGRMDIHGAAMSRTWVKLGAHAANDSVTLSEEVDGWWPGDRVILTATTRQNKVRKTFKSSVKDYSQTETRIVESVDGVKIALNRPLAFEHLGEGAYRGEIANLSRNVVIKSADPDGGRGHVMVHRNSTGSISYAEFRDLGKPGVLGRYNLHYHLCGDTMRGSSVIGCSFVNSYNRWLTIHGTNYLVVRDCVGCGSQGHGFFLEDGTEVNNILDRNLAVQAYTTKPLPKQIIPFDKNDGSGFWWANCHNSFTRNVAAECDEYGYFFQAAKTKDFDPNLRVLRPDGSRQRVDIRTLPFIRFEDNVTHCQRRHGFNLGGGVPFGEPNVGGVGPDVRHPFEIRNFKAYNTHWAIHPVAPSVAIDGIDIVNSEYGIWRPVYKDHAYRGITMTDVPEKLQYAFVEPSQPPIPENKYPGTLQPVDDLPPVTVITHVLPGPGGKLIVRGSTADNGKVKRVLVNDQPAKATTANFLTWETVVDGSASQVTAHAEDEAGNVEKMKHVRAVSK